MSDNNLPSEYSDKRDQRVREDQLARLKALDEPQPMQQPQGSVSVEGAPAAPAEGKSWYQEVVPQIYSGAKSGFKNSLEAIDDAANWLNDNVVDLRTVSQTQQYQTFKETGVRGFAQDGTFAPIQIEKGEKAQTFAGNLAHGASEFLVGFLPALRGLRLITGGAAVGTAAKIAEGAIAGGTGAYFSLDPTEKRLSNMINDLDPVLRNPVTEFLATDPNDSNAMGRFKNALENTLIGVGTDLAINGLVKGMTAFKGYLVEKGMNAGQILKEAGEEATTRAAVTSELDTVLKQADAIKAPGEAAYTPELAQPTVDYLKKIGAIGKDGESVNIEVLRSAQDRLMARVPLTTDTAVLKAPEFEGIFGAKEATPVFKTSITPKQVDALVDQIMIGDPNAISKTKGIDFNFSKLDTPEQIREVINATSAAFAKSTSEATRGKVTFKEISEFADQIGSSAKDLEALYGSTGDLAERFLAGRVLLQKSSNQLVETANFAKSLLYNTAFKSSEEKEAAIQAAALAVRKQAMIHGDLQAQLKGSQTEIARALSAMRMNVKNDSFNREELSSLLDHFGGQKMNQDFVEKIAQLANNPEALNKFTRGSWKARTFDALQELWTNSILSSPITQSANIIGNSLRAVGGVAETASSATVGLFRRGAPADRATYGEAMAQAVGMMEGIKESLVISFKANEPALVGTAYKAFNGGVDASISSFDKGVQFDAAITAKNLLGKHADTTFGRVFDYIGSAIRIPGKLLSAEDQLFYTMNYRGSLKQNAYRMARQEGLEGEAFVARMADLIENPSDDLLKSAHDAAIDGTFAKKLDPNGGFLDKMGLWIQNGKNKNADGQQLVPGLHYIVPFVKTPTNIIKYAYDRVPALNLLSEQNRAIMAEGGRAADQLYAQYATGGTLLALGSYLASQGHMTGGMSLDNKSTKEIGGVQPYSFKIGDTYYAYNRLDPLGMFLGLAADMADLSGHWNEYKGQELAYAAVSSVVKNLSSKTYLQGIVDFVGAVDDLMKGKTLGAEKFVKNFTTGFIPFKGALGAVNRSEVDPVMRETWDLIDQFKASIPGFSSTLPPHRNLLTGDPVVYQGGLGVDMASPIYQSKEAVDPSAKEISRLNMNLEHPSKRIGNVDLSPDQYDRLMVLLTKEVTSNGKTMVENLNERVSRPDWADKSERQIEEGNAYLGSKEFEIKKIFSAYKQGATQKLLSEDPELLKSVMNDKRNKGNALLGNPLEAINNK